MLHNLKPVVGKYFNMALIMQQNNLTGLCLDDFLPARAYSVVWFVAVCLFLFPVHAFSLTEEEAEKWLDSDDLNPPSYKPVIVNDGVLDFLPTPPMKRVHHHHNTLTISPASLSDGWVTLSQCHQNMDRVPLAQVVFNKDTIKHIRVTKVNNIAKAWVEGSSVQIEDVQDNARLCIEARSQSLKINPDGTFTLRNGPFMRKFLDGYYPLHVTVDVEFAGTGLKLVTISPVAQAGFKIDLAMTKVSLDAWFEGRLLTELTFKRTPLATRQNNTSKLNLSTNFLVE